MRKEVDARAVVDDVTGKVLGLVAGDNEFIPVTAQTNPVTGGITKKAGSRALPDRCIGAPRVVLFGDSYAIYDRYVSANSVNAGTAGLWHALTAAVGDHRMVRLNAGIGGNTTAMMRARLPSDVLAKSPTIVLGNGGVNDFYGAGAGFDRTVADVLADVLYMIDALLDAGIIVAWANCPTQATTRSNYTAARQAKALDYNKQLAVALATRPTVRLIDVAALVMDPASADFSPRSSMLGVDGIHLSHSATMGVALRYSSWLDALLPYVERPFSPADCAANVASDSLLAAGIGQMQGSAGTAGTGVSGTIPTGWTVTGTAGATTVCSKIADLGGDWLEVAATVSGQATGQQIVVNTSASIHSLLAAGDKAEVLFEMEVEPGAADVLRVYGRLYTVDGNADLAAGQIWAANWNDITNGDVPLALPQVSARFAPITPRLDLTKAPTNARVYFYLHVKGTGTAKLRIRNVKVRKTAVEI